MAIENYLGGGDMEGRWALMLKGEEGDVGTCSISFEKGGIL